MRTLRGRIHWKRALFLTVLLSSVGLLALGATPALAADAYICADAKYDIVSLYDWPANTPVTIQIDADTDPSNGVLFARDLTITGFGWAEIDDLGVDLKVGQYVRALSGSVTSVTRVVPLDVTTVDVNTDTVSGTADPGADVFVYTYDDDVSRSVKAGSNGQWTADFKGISDIKSGSYGYADVYGGYDGYSRQAWYIVDPVIQLSADVGSDYFSLWSWPWKSTVKITIDDDGNPGNGGVVYAKDVTIPIYGREFVDLPQALQSGQYITAEASGSTKVLRVAPLAVTHVDLATNKITGTAEPGAQLTVGAYDKGQDVTVTAGPDGKWTADLTSQCDLVGGDSGAADLTDADGDWIFASWATSAITIKTSAVSVKRGKQFVLSGVCKPYDVVEETMHVDVRKPGKSYWTYSSNRVIYDKSGTAAWQYKYTTLAKMALGTYTFRAVWPGNEDCPSATSLSVKVNVTR